MQCLLGEVEVAEEANQGGEDATRVGVVDGVHLLAHLLARALTHTVSPQRMLSGAHYLRDNKDAYD